MKFVRPKCWLEYNAYRMDLVMLLERRRFFTKRYQAVRMIIYRRMFIEQSYKPIFRYLNLKYGIGLGIQCSCLPASPMQAIA